MAQENIMKQGVQRIEDPIPAGAVGFAVFAGAMMVIVGICEALQGISVLANDEFLLVGQEYLYAFDATSWGWWHLIAGIIMAIAGFGIFSGNAAARGVGIVIAAIAAIANFAFIPYYPFWAILLIVLDIGVIWGLANYNPKKYEEA